MPSRRLYIETSVVSYLTANASRDVVVAGQQQITREWWNSRTRFELFVSDAVISEAGRGDPNAAARRLEALSGIPLLEATQEAQALANEILHTATMPPKAAVDAAHVAIATVHGLDSCLLGTAHILPTRQIDRELRRSVAISGTRHRSSALRSNCWRTNHDP